MRIFQAAVLAALMALPVVAQAGPVKVWETDADQSKLLAPQADIDFGEVSGTVITVDPSRTYQSMVGFGASMTDASAWLIRNKMTASQRDALMNDLFGAEGLGFSFTRLTIGASDFSREHYSYDDMPKGERDPEMAHFSIEAAKADVIPAVKQALSLNPKMTVMASPWSASGWMKTTDSLIQGSLKPEAYPYFADYLSRYLTDMRAEGVDITLLTIQNEPGSGGGFSGWVRGRRAGGDSAEVAGLSIWASVGSGSIVAQMALVCDFLREVAYAIFDVFDVCPTGGMHSAKI